MNGLHCFPLSDPLEENTRRLKLKPFALARVCVCVCVCMCFFHLSFCNMDDWELKQKGALRNMSGVSNAPPLS